MGPFLATIRPVGKSGLFIVEPVGATDPGFGGGKPPTDPDYGHPGGGWSPTDPGFGAGKPPTDPGYGHPGIGAGHPSNPLPVPPPEGVVSPPIVLPERPHLLAGAGLVVPLPAGASVPAPKTPPAPGTVPYILWFGPGTASSVVYLPPASAPK
jgi:hypothetical protein